MIQGSLKKNVRIDEAIFYVGGDDGLSVVCEDGAANGNVGRWRNEGYDRFNFVVAVAHRKCEGRTSDVGESDRSRRGGELHDGRNKIARRYGRGYCRGEKGVEVRDASSHSSAELSGDVLDFSRERKWREDCAYRVPSLVPLSQGSSVEMDGNCRADSGGVTSRSRFFERAGNHGREEVVQRALVLLCDSLHFLEVEKDPGEISFVGRATKRLTRSCKRSRNKKKDCEQIRENGEKLEKKIEEKKNFLPQLKFFLLRANQITDRCRLVRDVPDESGERDAVGEAVVSPNKQEFLVA